MKKISAVLLVFLVFLLSKYPLYAQTCTDFAVIVGNWGDASLQRFDGTTGNYSNQLATGIGARINSVLQYPSPNGNLYLGGYEEVNVVNAFTGAVSFSFTGGSLSGLTEQIVVGLDGKVYVANEGTGSGLGSIARYNASTGVFIDNFISFPSYQPNGLAQDAAGNWYVSTRNSPNQVLKYNSSGVLQGVVATMGTTQQGGGLKVYNNELYVVTTDSPQTVKVYSLPVTSFPATPVRTLNTGGSTYVGIAFGPDNNMYMADFYNSRVSVWNPITGTLVRNLTDASITNPHGVGFTTCTPCTPPTVGTAVATQATCTGSTANSDAKITISGLSGGDKYSYGTDTTAFTYAGATAYSGSSINITGLANPSTATTYYVRVYNGSGLCFKTVSVVLQPKNCSTPVVVTPICATNQIGNYSLEDGTSNVTTTIGGSDATFAVSGGDGPTDIHVEANGTYWVNAGSNGGKGSINGNYLIWYPTTPVGNNNKCTSWMGGSYTFSVGSCYSICNKVAAFNPSNLSEGSVALIEFGDPAVGWTKSFTTGGILETGDPSIYAVSWNLPAPSAPKDITGAAYTGASGQVIDWKTLDWQTVCINMTPPSTQSGIGINFSTKGDAATGVTKGMALDDISVCTGCTVVCTKPTVGTAVATQATCTGSTANSDAKITISGLSGGDKYSYGTDSTTFTYAGATAYSGASINITGLANPSTATTYYVRVYNGSNTCYKTVSVVLQPKVCCVKPNAGLDQNLSCGIVTGQRATSLLTADISGGVWSSPSAGVSLYSASSNPTFAYISNKGVFPIIYTVGGCSDTLTVTFQDLPSSCTDTWVNFATPKTVNAVTTNTNQYATIDDVTNIIGGELDITLKELVGNGGSGSNVDIYNGVLTWNHGPGRFSNLTLDWDGNDNDAAVFNPTGLGGLNLSGSGKFQFIINSVDVAKFNIKLRLYTDATNISESTFSMDQAGNLNSNIPVVFNTFSVVSGTGANLSNIGAIQLLFSPKNLLSESNGIDMELACFKTPCLVQCVKPTVGTAVATQATCTGSTANSDAKITISGLSGGDKYSYGTDSTSFTYAGATAYSGASINITGLANPSTATTYYVRVYNGSNTCYKTVSVVLQPKTCVVACTISASLSQVSCNNNATLSSASDDYITALLTPTGTAGERFTLTATRGGNPIAVTFADGTTIGQLSYAYPTPIRFANGSAGAGNIVLTLTDVANTTCSTTVTLTDPGTCAVTACTPTPQTVSYAYRTTFQTTDLNAVPLVIPKFDTGGGTRTLTKVELKFGMTQATNALTENTAVTSASFKLGLNTSSLIELGSTVLLDKSNTYSTGSTSITLPAGIVVAASGTYGGDQTYSGGTTLSTLEGMKAWLEPYMADIVGVSPLMDSRWVTNATGVATNDDDIFYIPTQTFADKDSVTYTTAGDLTQFVGTGNLPLTATTLNGITTTGGGGNLITKQNTKAYAYATIIYTYTCCTQPIVGTPTSTQATCTGSVANSDAKIDVTGISGGDKYSYGTDSTSFTYASATAFTGASISITGLANPSTATTYYVRVYNGLENCYKTVSVLLQPKTCIACSSTTYPLCAGESYTLSTPSGMTNVQWYKDGVAIAAPTGTATSLVVTTIGDYVYTGLPSGGTCKDSLCCPVKIVAGTNCCVKPTVGTATSTQSTCTGSTANSDAKLSVLGISGGDKYSYGTDSTSFSYASATAFTGASINITGLANPSSATTYYVRVYNGSETCYKTVSMVLQPKTCVVGCTSPTVGVPTATSATCNGAVANTDAKIDISGIAGGDKYIYGTSTSGFSYASAIAFTGGSLTIGGLTNPTNATTYYVRIYNGSNTCFTDAQVLLQPTLCNTPCGQPNCLSIGVIKN